MAVLDKLEPGALFSYFEELCGIPHGSWNVQAISDHLVAFAKAHDLEYVQDEALNVIIKKPGTKGYEGNPPIILQGHMDMVAVSEPDAGIDMQREPLRLMTDGEWVWADKTSLGGDDGFAVALCMALLAADDIPHPPLEVVITTQEEVGMDGARTLDASHLSGKRFLNLDSEEEGVLLTGCAGGARFHARLGYDRIKRSGTAYELRMTGLYGGHSGAQIHLGRGNACVLTARLLYELYKVEKLKFSLCSIDGGVADNAIPAEAKAIIVLSAEVSPHDLNKAVENITARLRTEYELKDPGLTIDIEGKESGTFDCFDEPSMKRIVKLILCEPNGVQAMSAAMEGLVETSLNLGVLRTDTESQSCTLDYAVRSSIASAKQHLIHKMIFIAKAFGATSEVTGEYPGWAYQTESPLRDQMVAVYERLYGKKPTVEAIHAGVECGFFAEKIPGLDCISIGPDMEDIHSTRERLNVASTKRTWEYVLAVLQEG